MSLEGPDLLMEALPSGRVFVTNVGSLAGVAATWSSTASVSRSDFEYPDTFVYEYFCRALALRAAWSGLQPGAQVKVTGLRPKVVKARGQARRATRRWTSLSRWSLLYAGRWTKEEHNNILEMRAAVGVLRHVSRSRRKWRQRVLLFTDSGR